MKNKAEIKATKKNLRTMSKTGGAHRLRTAGRVVKYGTIGFGRNLWLSIASTLVMTITLIVLFVTVVASAVLTSTADSMRQKIDITIFFRPGTSQETLDNMADIIRQDANVREVEVSNSEQEYQNFLDENADDEVLMATLADPAMGELMVKSMQATMRVKVYDIDNIEALEATVNTEPQFVESLDPDKVPTYDMNRAEIETVTSWADIAKNGGIVLSVIFIVISILVIFNTIRMAIFSRREEIYMMKLVGAENSFIRGPFLIEAQLCGIISGAVAATVGYFGCHFLAPRLEEYGISMATITNVLESQKLILVYLVTIAIGIVIGTISARLAISRYLNKK